MISIATFAVNAIILVASVVLWVLAVRFDWISTVEFVSHVSMLALLFSAISGVASSIAGIIALVPTDDLFD